MIGISITISLLREKKPNISIKRNSSRPNSKPRTKAVIMITTYDLRLKIEKNRLTEPKKIMVVSVIHRLDMT